jgi:hypothetical protein
MTHPTSKINEPKISSDVANVPEYVAKLILALNRVQEEVSKIVKEKQFKNIQPSLGKTTLSYNVGDKVGLAVESLPAGIKSTKLFPRFAGPFTIIKVGHGGKVLYLADANGKERKVPNSLLKVKPWPDRQTLLEQFEQYELAKRKSKPKVTNPDDFDVMGNKIVDYRPKTNVNNNEIDMEVERTDNVPKVHDVEMQIDDINDNYNPDEYDIMGNRIVYTNALKNKILQKVNDAVESTLLVQFFPQYRGRQLSINNNVPVICRNSNEMPMETQNVLFMDSNSNIGDIIDQINIMLI